MACQSNQLGGIVSGPRETLDAGKVSARKNIEQKIGRSVISRDNHLPAPQPKFPTQKATKKDDD